MPVKLFSLRDVPDDEAEEVREILNKFHVDYYETPAGNWGISMPAIWLKDTGQLEYAKMLISRYQDERTAKIRSKIKQLEDQGISESVIDRIKYNPVRFVIYLLTLMLILYISIKPFLDFGP